jgi:hypothetical protein
MVNTFLCQVVFVGYPTDSYYLPEASKRSSVYAYLSKIKSWIDLSCGLNYEVHRRLWGGINVRVHDIVKTDTYYAP